MRPPKKPKANSPERSLLWQGQPELPAVHETQQFGQQPALDEEWLHMFGVYANTVAGSDLSEFPKHVRMCVPQARPMLAKRLADDLVAERPTAAEAMTRVAVALNNGLPLKQVIASLTAEEPRTREVRALWLLLRDCAIRDFTAGKPVDLLLWTQCIRKARSAEQWMTELGWSMALDLISNGELLRCWLPAMTSLAYQVRGRKSKSDLVLALLTGFDGGCKPELLDERGGLIGEARATCGRLRAQLARAAEELVAELDKAVRKASTLAKEDIAQPIEQRRRRIREDLQVLELGGEIADGLASGVLTLKEVIDALERLPPGNETMAALMHVLVVQAKGNGGELHAFLKNVLKEAARPEELVLYMTPALLERESDTGLAVGLVHRLVDEAAGALTRLVPLLRLSEELCRVEGSQTLLPLNERVKGIVQEAAAKLVMEARQCVERATDNLLSVLELERTARLTAEQLEQLGGELLESSIEALVGPLDSPMACGFVLEALRSSTRLPASGHLVSLLVRALMERWTVVDVFMVALANADVPPTESKAHMTLARQVAHGFADWFLPHVGIDDRIGVWIGRVAVNPGASTMGFTVLQVILDELSSLNKWGSDIRSSLVRRRTEVEKRLMAKKAEALVEQCIIPVLSEIEATRKQVLGINECSIADEDDREEVLKNENINAGANELVLAVRRSDISMRGVIERLSFGRETAFDWQLLLLRFIDPLFEESAVSFPYDLNNFMNSLFDVDGTSDFFRDVGIVFATRDESTNDRSRMIGAIRALFIQYTGKKLSRLLSFAAEYHAGTDDGDQSHELEALLNAMDDKLKGNDAPDDTAGSSLVPKPAIPVQPAISLLPTAGMLPGAFSQSVIESSSVPGVGQPSNPGFPIFPADFGSRVRRPSATAPLVVTKTSRRAEPQLPGTVQPLQGDPAARPIPTIWLPPPSNAGDDSLPAESDSDFESDSDPEADPVTGAGRRLPDGLPPHYSEMLPQDNARVISISAQSELNIFANGVVEALNGGNITAVKQVITSAHLTVLNLAGPAVPMLHPQGLETLGKLMSDPSVVLRALALGKVTRGIGKLIEGVGKSSHLEVLNLCSFEGHDLERKRMYNIANVLERMAKLYPSQSRSLPRLVVSGTMISAHQAQTALAELEAAAGGRLKVEQMD